MQKHIAAWVVAGVVSQITRTLFGSVPVEQIEAYENYPANTAYAPTNFNGNTSVTEGYGDGGQFYGITLHADPALSLNNTASGHANTVGTILYGQYSVAYPYVRDVYNTSADQFLNGVLAPLGTTGMGPLPGNFSGGSKVINNSYVGYENTTSAYQDDNRRIDYMVNSEDVVWIAGAVTTGSGFTHLEYLAWSNFNGLAISGIQNTQQSFNPAGSPGKQHADLSVPSSDASFSAAQVSGYAAALWGSAQNDSLLDAEHGYVVRSLLMTGADKGSYTRPANLSNGAIDPVNGAGQPNYITSLTVLTGGEKPLASGGISSSISTSQDGWACGPVGATGQSVVLFKADSPITSLTASLNWNINTPLSGTTQLNTSSTIFPNLTVEVRPVNYNSSTGQYVLGTNQSDATLHSAVANDNVQYLYSTNGLAAGSYAFVINGDSKLPANIGFSYLLEGRFASQWTSGVSGSWFSPGSWTNGVPNETGAQANLLASPGAGSASTITLDGFVTLGQLTFNNPNSYTVAAGNNGVLRINASGDPLANPLISSLAGSHFITAPVRFDNGLNVNVSAGALLTIIGAVTESGSSAPLTKNGSGALILTNAESYGATVINGGTLSLTDTASLSAAVSVNSAGTLNFTASSNSGILIRTQQIYLQSNGAVTLNAASSSPNRQLLVSSGLALPGSYGNWAGKIDLSNNDLVIPGGSLRDITNQLAQGYNAAGGGNWNGSAGISSSYIAANNASLEALGVIQNDQNGTPLFTATRSFDGYTPGIADILVKFTYVGDANLDGKVDGSDFSLIDAAFIADRTNSTVSTGWYNGDFNYDGVVNGSDYTLIDNAFNSQGAALSAAVNAASVASPAAVPEPTTLAWLGITATALLGRPRRGGRFFFKPSA